jgi:hypothetical protein
MSYADDLKHPLWQRCRLRVFERAGFRCERCESDSRQLHAHHKLYHRGRKPWDYPDDLLECLCDACHSQAHAERDALEMMIAKHPTAIVPTMTRIFGKLGEALASGDFSARTHLMNAVQDEIDAIEDLRRGPGCAATEAPTEQEA